jgi:pyrroloquinoline quinone (PQQ) biosynthesis protein C
MAAGDNSAVIAGLDALVRACNEAASALYLTHPTPEAAHVYVQQWGVFTRHSRQCWAWVVGNCPEVEVRRFITKENLFEEEGDVRTSHYERLVRLGASVGLDCGAIDDADPLPSTELALLVCEALTKNRSWQEGLAAKAVIECTGFPTLRRVRQRIWQEALRLTDDDADFFATHIETDELHASGAYDLVARYVRPAETRAVLAAPKTSLRAWALYCNGIAACMQARGGVLRPIAA